MQSIWQRGIIQRTMTQVSTLANINVQISRSRILLLLVYYYSTVLLFMCLELRVDFWDSIEFTQVLLEFSSIGPALPQFACICVKVSPLSGLPNPPINFYWAQFGLGVWGKRTPGCLATKSHSWARRGLCGTNFTRYPEGPYTAVHPRFQRLTHQLGFPLGLLHGGLLGRQLQHGAQLLEVLLQVQVTGRTCVEPAILPCSGHLDLHKERKLKNVFWKIWSNQKFHIWNFCHIISSHNHSIALSYRDGWWYFISPYIQRLTMFSLLPELKSNV